MAAEAAEALRVLARLRRHRPPPASPPSPPLTLSSVWLRQGSVEAGLHGVVLGGVAGFAGAAAVLAALRTSEADALPWLLVTPAVAALAGGAGAVGAVVGFDVGGDDVSFVASTTWAGLALATAGQIAVLSGSVDVAAPAVGFATTLAGAAAGLGLGVALAPWLDVSSGDAALANSGLVWGGVLGLLGASVAGNLGSGLAFGDGVLIVGASAGAAWLAATAAHPFVDLHRLSTWLIDAGGGAGLLLGASAAAALGSAGTTAQWGVTLGGTTLGLAAGAGLAVVVDAAFADDAGAADAPPPLLTSVRPGVVRSPAGAIVPGLQVEVARW